MKRRIKKTLGDGLGHQLTMEWLYRELTSMELGRICREKDLLEEDRTQMMLDLIEDEYRDDFWYRDIGDGTKEIYRLGRPVTEGEYVPD